MHVAQQVITNFSNLSNTEQYYFCTAILISFLFIISTVTDIRKREIPILLWGIAGCLAACGHAYFQTGYTEFLIAAAFLIIWYFLQAILFTGGGGDIIMMGVFGFCIGIVGTLVTIIASGFAISAYCIFYRIRHKHNAPPEYPVAPFAALGFAVYLILSYTEILLPYEQTIRHLFA